MKLTGAGFRRYIAAGEETYRAALAFGPNRAHVEETVRRLVERNLAATDDPFALTRIAEDELKRERTRLGDALAAQSLLGGPRVVWLRIEGDSQAETVLAALADIERGAPSAFLVVEGGDLAAKGKIASAFEAAKAAAAIPLYEESAAERAAFLKGLVDEMRIPLTADAREALAEFAPPDRGVARREVEKIALFAHDLGRPVEAEDLAALAAIEADGTLDEATIAALSGDAARAVIALDGAESANGVSVIKALERRLLRVLEARTLVEGGSMSAGDAGDRLKPKVFWKERDLFAGHVRLWASARLTAALDVVWAAERRAKTAGAPADEIAANAYVQVARLARAGGKQA